MNDFYSLSLTQKKDETVDLAVAKINSLLETFMGIHDSELAQTIWELGRNYHNPHEFCEVITNSEISDFGFSEDFIFDLWGAINDARTGRINPSSLNSSNASTASSNNRLNEQL